MKDLLLNYLTMFMKVLIVFFSPIKGIILLVALSTITDTIFGIWKAKRLKEKVTSKKARLGLVPKLISYIALIMLVFMSDKFIINSLTLMVVDVEYIATKIISLAMLSIEACSINESYYKVKGVSIIGKIKTFIIKAKEVKKGLRE